MRTTFDIDRVLLDELLRRMPGLSATEAVERAVCGYLADDASWALRAIAGTVRVDDISAEMRRVDRRA